MANLTAAAALVLFIATVTQMCSAVTYSAYLTGAANNVTTSATGAFNGNFNSSSADYTLTIANIADAFQAHLHLLPPTNPNGPVVVWLFNSTDSYITVTGSATIVGSFTEANLVGPLGGQSFSALLDALSANQIYVNVHTQEYPNGLIRSTTRAESPAPAPAPLTAGE